MDKYEKLSEKAARNRNQQFAGLGKLPPQAVDIEESVLGALMLQKDAYLTVSEYLRPEMFYMDKNQKIYEKIINLITNSSPVDILTVINALRKAGELEMIGGAYYITELTERVTGAVNIDFYARVIYEKYLQREMIRLSTDTISSAYDDTTDVFEIHDKHQSELFNLFNFTNSKNIDTISSLLDTSIADLNKEYETGLTGVGSGFYEMDNLTNGWQKSDFVIIAARPAMGKSALMLKLARNAAVDFNKPVVVFSLEMSKYQLVNRIISDETDIPLTRILKRQLSEYDKQKLNSTLNKIKNSGLFIDDTPGLSIQAFRSKCIRLKKKHDVQLIIIDYLQLMTITGVKPGNREQEISKISAACKMVAKELNVPVIALSQLSRQVESRAGMAKRPMLSDLRESGSIEQDADQVLFLYRPEYYGITHDADNNSVEQLCEVIFAKFRNGETDTIKLRFDGTRTRFTDWLPVSNQFPANDFPLNNFTPSDKF